VKTRMSSFQRQQETTSSTQNLMKLLKRRWSAACQGLGRFEGKWGIDLEEGQSGFMVDEGMLSGERMPTTWSSD